MRARADIEMEVVVMLAVAARREHDAEDRAGALGYFLEEARARAGVLPVLLDGDADIAFELEAADVEG